MTLAALGLLAGCTYLEQRQDLMQGGPWNRIATANASLQAAKTQNQDLQDQQLQTEREIERNNRRMEKTQADLDRVSAELEAARKRKQISEAEYQRLKREVATANGDLSSVNMQLDAGRVTGSIDNADKERQIKALENKKSELEKALGMSPRPEDSARPTAMLCGAPPMRHSAGRRRWCASGSGADMSETGAGSGGKARMGTRETSADRRIAKPCRRSGSTTTAT